MGHPFYSVSFVSFGLECDTLRVSGYGLEWSETTLLRLVKDMRLARINTPEEGNRFLEETFLPKFNAKFAVLPAQEGDVHKPLTYEDKNQISHIISIHETRRINLDFTIQFKNTWYQLTEIQPTTVRPLLRVTMETWLDQSIHIMLNGYELAFILLPKKPKKQRIRQPTILTTHTVVCQPVCPNWILYRSMAGLDSIWVKTAKWFIGL